MPLCYTEQLDGLSELNGRSNIFLGKTSEDDITSGKIDNLVTNIEIWANQETGEFGLLQLRNIITTSPSSLKNALCHNQASIAP